jgi:hypothetical protein
MIPRHLEINESSPFGTGRKENKRKTKMGEIVTKIKKIDQSCQGQSHCFVKNITRFQMNLT